MSEEIQAVEVAENTFIHDLMAHCIDEFRAMPEVWQKLSKQQQDEAIERLGKCVQTLARQAVDTIASYGLTRVAVNVGDITIKDLEAVAKITGPKGDHAFYDMQGERAYLVISDAQELPKQPHAHQGDEEQRHLELPEEGAEAGAESPPPSQSPQEDPAPAETSEILLGRDDPTAEGVDDAAESDPDAVDADFVVPEGQAPPVEGDDLMEGQETDVAPVTLEDLPVDQAHCERVVAELTTKGPYEQQAAVELVAAAAVGEHEAIDELEQNLVDDADELLGPFFTAAGIDRTMDLSELE